MTNWEILRKEDRELSKVNKNAKKIENICIINWEMFTKLTVDALNNWEKKTLLRMRAENSTSKYCLNREKTGRK